MILLLDIAEVADSHTGSRLAKVINTILQGYGVEDKVSRLYLNAID